MKRVLQILVFAVFALSGAAQETKTDSVWVMGIVLDGDTLIHKNIKQIIVFPEREFDNRRQARRYSRLEAKVKKVYPLALKARELLEKYEPQYYALDDRRDRRKLMKNLEKELLAEHKDELKTWSISDGRLLLKLINRETERTPYALLQDFRGDFSAVFWQGIAMIFKNNLKDGYDPDEEDRMLEEIVTMMELGYL